MKSIQTKFILLIVIGILASAVIIGGVGTYSFRTAMQKDCGEIMSLTCEGKAQELNTVFGRIEQSVEVLAVSMVDMLDEPEKLGTDAEYMASYVEELEDLSLTVANETKGSIAVYIRFNPEITDPKAGFFYTRKSEKDTFEAAFITDLSEYGPDDTKYTNWYYEPVTAGKSVWIMPYQNSTIGVYMISYVIPVYIQDTLLGVVGMDISFDYITDMSDGIQCYDTGHAFLTDNDLKIIHSKHFKNGTSLRSFSDELENADISQIVSTETVYEYRNNGKPKEFVIRPLENGMYLVVIAPLSEVNHIPNKLALGTCIIVIVMAIIFIIITIKITKNIVRPLQELNLAAKEIAEGNLNISVSCKSKDEVGTLAESIRDTAEQLKVKIDYINNLAYIDKLTSMKNNTAYYQERGILEKDIRDYGGTYAVILIDVNGLKYINDTYGHDYGNELLIALSKVVVHVFGYENSYRIGGDEFLAVMKDCEEEKCKELEKEFGTLTQNPIGKVKVSAATGHAIYDKSVHDGFEDVFKDADNNMYAMKYQMKKRGETSDILR
ncbi:MAG: diguanylate cyclase domain-containing protein [Lachnospiraceae bacterium]